MFKALLMHVPEEPSTKNAYGDWVPAIPEPFWVGRFRWKPQCLDCAAKPTFKSETEYRGHYALFHVLGLQ